MRDVLNMQLQSKRDGLESEMRKDRALLDESTKRNEMEITKYRQKEESMKKQLREINRDRAVLRKEREDVW